MNLAEIFQIYNSQENFGIWPPWLKYRKGESRAPVKKHEYRMIREGEGENLRISNDAIGTRSIHTGFSIVLQVNGDLEFFDLAVIESSVNEPLTVLAEPHRLFVT